MWARCVQERVDAFSAFVKIREDTRLQRRMDTIDSMLTAYACPNGHEWRLMGLSSVAYDGVDAIAAALPRAPSMPPCGECGGARSAREALLATYLPVADADVLVHHRAGEAPRLSLLTRGGDVTRAEPDDPRVREAGPASLARHLVFALRASATPPTLQEAEDLARRHPNYGPAHIAHGRVLRAAGDVEGAAAAYERAVAVWPAGGEARFFLADALDDLRQDERALREYDEAARLLPDDPEVHVQRGIVLKRLGRREEAWAAYQRAEALDAHHAGTRFSMAVWHAQLEDFEKAVASLEEARPSELARHPGRDSAIAILAERASQLAQKEEWLSAARCFDLMHAIRPEAKSVYNAAACLANAGVLGEALLLARQARDMTPPHASAGALVAQLEPAVAQGVREDLVGLRIRHNLRYVDSWGNPATMLNFIVKAVGTTYLMEIEAYRLTLDRERDIVKLLVAKGHNASLAPAAPKKSLFDDVLASSGFRSAPAPAARIGRPFVFVTEEEPDPAFVRLAAAKRWRTPEGRVVESAPVEILLAEGDGRRRVPLPDVDEATLPRHPDLEPRRAAERFFPERYAHYD